MTAEEAGATAEPLSIYDLLRPSAGRRSVLRLPRLIGRALGLVWAAARGEVIILGVMQIVGGMALAGELLVARSFLAAVLGQKAHRGTLGDVLPSLVALGVLAVISGFAAATAQERQRLLGELTGRYAQGRLLNVATTVRLEAFETPAFHDRLLRATVNAQIRPVQMATGLSTLASGLFGVVGVGVALATLEPLVVPLVILAFAPLWLVAVRNSQALYQLASDLTAGDRERAYLQQLLVGKHEAKELRAYQLAGFLRGRYDQLYDQRIVRIRALVNLRQRRSLVATAAASVLTMGAIGGLVQLTLVGRISVATAAAAALGLQQLTSRLRGVFTGASSLYECSLFLEDVTSFLDLADHGHESGGANGPGGAGQPRAFTDVCVEDLSFTYPGTKAPVLRDVNLRIGRGEVVAVVGENGSGKTTLVKLLCGLYAPSSGRILWGGTDLADLDAEAARGQVAVIFQDYLRYELAAAVNIGVGRHEDLADGERVQAAAQTAGADDFLRRLPYGYDTLLSRAFLGGSELSVGQWQRVALARTFFRDAPFVILDEPTAALDARAEHEMFERLADLLEDRAVLLISHRFSSVRSADRIYVLADGVVVESGTHDSLMALGGHYAKLFDLQALGYRDDPAATDLD